jgi:hypothetical protein
MGDTQTLDMTVLPSSVANMIIEKLYATVSYVFKHKTFDPLVQGSRPIAVDLGRSTRQLFSLFEALPNIFWSTRLCLVPAVSSTSCIVFV